MTSRQAFKKIHRELRITGKGLETFKKHMDLILDYRLKYDCWDLPIRSWHTNTYRYKNDYLPYRKFSVVLRQWSTVDKFEY